MGKTILLSDIPVHREQAPARGHFFDPKNAETLAELMLKHLIAYDKAEEERLTKAAIAENEKRFIDFGKAYQTIALRFEHKTNKTTQ